MLLVVPLSRWLYLALSYAVLIGIVVALARAWGRPQFLRRSSGDARPEDIAVMRIVVGVIILINLLYEDLASTAGLPRELVSEMGIMNLLHDVPGFSRMLVHYKGLLLAQVLLGFVTLLAVLGFFTRTACLLSGVAFVVMGGIIRHYSSYYHSMLVPSYVMLALAAVPCGDAWSIDAWLRRRHGLPPKPSLRHGDVYRWSRLLIWAIIVTGYVQAGLSKLANGGLAWLSPSSFREIILTDSLRSYYFIWKSDFGLWVASLPDWVMVLLATGSVLAETLFFLVLLWPWARRIMPIVIIGMHAGIWLIQNVSFVDMILIQLVFYNIADLLKPQPAQAQEEPAGETPDAALERRKPRLLPALILFVIAAQGVIWIHRVEWYPLTATQMYSRALGTGAVEYHELLVVYADGTRRADSPGHDIATYWEGRARPLAQSALRGSVRRPDAFFAHWAKVHNQTAPSERQIVAFELNNRVWNYRDDPDDPGRGAIEHFYRYDVQTGRSIYGRMGQ